MENNKIIIKYHSRLSREMGCHQTPRFKIGETVEVRRGVVGIRHGEGRAWIEWDGCRQEIEGKRAEIVDVNYTDDDNSDDKAGCIGYMINVEGRRGHIAVHEEALKKVRVEVFSKKIFFDTITEVFEHLDKTPIQEDIGVNEIFGKEILLCLNHQRIIMKREENNYNGK